MSTRKLRRLAFAVIACGGAAGLLATAGVTVASAETARAADRFTGRVTTNGLLLNTRSGPSTEERREDRLEHGTKVTIVCQEAGQRVEGKVRTTVLWDRLPDGSYVSDSYVTRRAAKIPRCENVVIGSDGQIQPPATRGVVVSDRGWTRPIVGAVGSGFRTRARPDHDGVDIGARKKTVIRAAAAGRVITAECNASTDNCDVDGSPRVSGCGWYVEIQHTDRVVTRYCHMIKRPSVRVGARVNPGKIIGYVGSSGNSSGPHLHFEVHTRAAPALSSNAVSPISYLRGKHVKLR